MLTVGCSHTNPHHGRFPFSLMEKPPSAKAADHKEKMKLIMTYSPEREQELEEIFGKLQAGDVIAFHMSHEQALGHLRKGQVQKIPYELFRYGHLALVVPDPAIPNATNEYRLLQLAMKQAANTQYGIDYLRDKSWVVYRPPNHSINVTRLHEFSKRVIVTASDPETSYDYAGTLGLRNAPWQPESIEEIGEKFSCTTLVVAGLHYSGYQLDAIHRKGMSDVVTPAQVVESYGKITATLPRETAR
jgi:hypothetical protein